MSTSTTHTPTAEEIVIIAGKYGYTTSSPEHNATLYFKKSDGCQLNVYHSTRGVMTFLDHPTRGRNGLWRSDVYTTTTDLEALFENPRKHTSTGYRKSENAEAGCTQCGERKKRTEFSKNQWTKRKEDKQKCASCIADGKQSSIDALSADITKLDILAKDERMRACSSCGSMRIYSDFPSATDNICTECEENEVILDFVDLSLTGREKTPP